MNPTHQCNAQWRANLVEALVSLHEVEGHYLDEIYGFQRQRELIEARFPRPFPVSESTRDRIPFYSHIWNSEGIYADRRYLPLRTALEKATRRIAQHPALTPLLKEDGRGCEFSFRILNSTRTTSCLYVVAGLMCRARQSGQDGFRTASIELESLLDSTHDDVGPGSNELTTAYHVSLFYGLQFTEDLHVTDGLIAAPLVRTSPFLNRGVLEDVMPDFARGHGWKGVGAMLSTVPWKLTLGTLGVEHSLGLDWGRSFFEDGRTFIELLTLAHGVPVIPLMEVNYCVHRTALHLLGQPHYYSSTNPTAWKLSFGRLQKPNQLDIEAFGEAKDIFLALDNSRLGDLEPVVTRLSQALARTGQYSADDKILDLAIALEQMYRQGWSNSYTLRTRAACFLESDGRARRRVFDDVAKLYGMRSKIIHADKKKLSPDLKKQAFDRGFRVARRSVFKLLREGSPADWTNIVLGSEG